MERYARIWRFLAILLVVALLLTALVYIVAFVFHIPEPFALRYNEKWIIGKTPRQIQNRYREFDDLSHTAGNRERGAYRLLAERKGFMDRLYPYDYVITFQDGVAVGVEIEYQSKGG